MSHIGTNRIDDEGEPDPDHDYRAWIDNSANPTWTSGDGTPAGNDFFTENGSGLLQRRYFGSDINEATGSATIHVPSIDLDVDSDNSGSIDGSLGEDLIEIDKKAGVFIQVLNGDADSDGVTDTVDFNGIAGAAFTPIQVTLSANLSVAGERSI